MTNSTRRRRRQSSQWVLAAFMFSESINGICDTYSYDWGKGRSNIFKM